jgi:hypothetical protein
MRQVVGSLGQNGRAMIGFLVLLFPVLLMIFMLAMEQIERPLTRRAPERDVEDFLEHANREEMDTFVREGTDSGLNRFRARLHLGNWTRRN